MKLKTFVIDRVTTEIVTRRYEVVAETKDQALDWEPPMPQTEEYEVIEVHDMEKYIVEIHE